MSAALLDVICDTKSSFIKKILEGVKEGESTKTTIAVKFKVF